MEYLLDLGFSESDINMIKKNNYSYIISNLEINKDKIIEIVRYLFEIGLDKSTIRDIFVKQVSLFFKTIDEIKVTFDDYEIDSVVKSLNFDVNNVELIDFI